jgi:hypothetical protein
MLWVTRRGSRGSSNCAASGSLNAVRSSASRRSRNPASPVSFSVLDATRTEPLHSGRKSSSVSPVARFLLFNSTFRQRGF